MKYNIIEKVGAVLEYRYKHSTIFYTSAKKLIENAIDVQKIFNEEIFKYLVIENNIFILIESYI